MKNKCTQTKDLYRPAISNSRTRIKCNRQTFRVIIIREIKKIYQHRRESNNKSHYGTKVDLLLPKMNHYVRIIYWNRIHKFILSEVKISSMANSIFHYNLSNKVRINEVVPVSNSIHG